MKLTRNFDDNEFFCPCCGRQEMDDGFMRKLQLARTIAGVPFHINSGWRCPTYNIIVDGAQYSSHMIGQAADIHARTTSMRFVIISALIEAGFERIGVAKTFLHVDDDDTKIERVMWLY
jgi:zinc D-Ala-D-Ala carboxypeptidase